MREFRAVFCTVLATLVLSCGQGGFLNAPTETLQAQDPVPEFNLNVQQVAQTMQTKWGFLHGFTNPCAVPPCTDPTSLILDLMPQDWRTADFSNGVLDWVISTVNFPAQIGTQITFVGQDAYILWLNFPNYTVVPICIVPANCPGQTQNAFASFDALKTSWSAFYDTLVASPRIGDINIFDIFAEPDNFMANLDEAQLFELFKIAHDKIRAAVPGAKVKGLSDSVFDQGRLERFYDYVLAQGLALNAISWHEFGITPLLVPGHVQTIRDMFVAKGCPGGTCPEIHIDEYQGPNTTLIPGDQALWLIYLVDAGVNRINRACWDVSEEGGGTMSTCWDGFNGMLDRTNTYIQSGYWVHKYFAGMRAADTRIKVETFSSDIHALAFLNQGANKTEILLGSAGFGALPGDTTPVKMLVELPASWNNRTATITTKLIPNNGNVILNSSTIPGDVTLQKTYVNAMLYFTYDLPKGSALYIAIVK